MVSGHWSWVIGEKLFAFGAGLIWSVFWNRAMLCDHESRRAREDLRVDRGAELERVETKRGE